MIVENNPFSFFSVLQLKNHSFAVCLTNSCGVLHPKPRFCSVPQQIHPSPIPQTPPYY
jgi:hypothetical protein